MQIEWDPAKAANNPKHHAGATVVEASQVLLDPFALTHEDRDARGESRFISLGVGGEDRLLIVVHTFRGQRIRIISAWKANAKQRKQYESQF